jgi:hypothetical protein
VRILGKVDECYPSVRSLVLQVDTAWGRGCAFIRVDETGRAKWLAFHAGDVGRRRVYSYDPYKGLWFRLDKAGYRARRPTQPATIVRWWKATVGDLFAF